MRLGIIDHGAGNLVSITNALARLGADQTIVTDPAALRGVDAIVLPGVGATGAAMRRLHDAGLDEALRRWEGPLLGICVGMQLLFERSAEDGGACLGILPGTVERLEGTPLPHMGWNDVVHDDDPLFVGIPSGEPFYFVHSYAPVPADPALTIATSDHGGRFVAVVRRGATVGVQFHPERSGVAGIRLLANYLTQLEEANRAA